MSFEATFASDSSFQATFEGLAQKTASFSPYIEVPVVDYYNGDYSITPSAEVQTIPLIGKTMRRNLVINPIPSNYGLIAWSGPGIRVS